MLEAANECGTHYKGTGLTDWLVGEGGPSEPRGPNYIPAASVIFLTSIVL